MFRLLSVIGSSGIGITYFVVIMESTGDKYRPRLGLLYITTTIGVGVVLLSFITMGLRNWQHVRKIDRLIKFIQTLNIRFNLLWRDFVV